MFEPKFSAARTKTEAIIVSVISPYIFSDILKDLKAVHFVTLTVDCSNRKDIKLTFIAVRYFSQNDGINVKLLHFDEVPGETSDILHDYILKWVEKYEVKEKVICLCADNTNTNFGGVNRRSEKNVFRKLHKSLKRPILGIGCSAHIVHNTMQTACDVLPVDVEVVVVKIYKYFYQYTVRVTQLKEFCDFAGVEYQRILSHGNTRFLSLQPALERILQQYAALKAFFLSSDCCPHLLKNLFENSTSEIYLLFAHGTLQMFQTSILQLESDCICASEASQVYSELLIKVICLKSAIEQYYGIPISKQVLLVSGGISLEDSYMVCMYSSGTDTNPIYLFNKCLLERPQPHIPWIVPSDFKAIHATDNELNQLFDSVYSASAPITIFTINKINQLAQRYFEQSGEMLSFCEQLNLDQHLQQQGWAAALANLDDVLVNFKSQCEAFDSSYIKYLENRQEHIDLINRFAEDMKLLSKIPLLPALLDVNEEERARIESCCDKSRTSEISLLEWISAKEPEHSIENVIETCKVALQKYNEHALETMRNDITSMFSIEKLRELHNMTEITDKLTTLSGLIVTIRDTHDDQRRKSHGINRNHDRAVDVNDDSILPDLFVTHKKTIQSMKSNHTNLRSCRHLCTQSKSELCDIIHAKLKDVMVIQERAAEIRSMLVLHSANIKRMREYIGLVQQLHTTPRNYFTAVSEVVRRRSYSQAFLMWASDLACRIYTIYTDETERRKRFQQQFEGHFLNCLFPGLEDMPPNFATQSPLLFDNNLPTLSEDDLNHLCKSLPEFEIDIDLPDVDAIRRFFLSKSLTLSTNSDEDNQMTASVEDKLAVVMSIAGINGTPHISDSQNDLGDKIATDMSVTENAAMVESVQDKTVDESEVKITGDMDDDDNKKEGKGKIDIVEHERQLQTMRDGMAMLGTVAHNTVVTLRNDLSNLRDWVLTHQSDAFTAVQKLYSQNQQLHYRVKCAFQKITEKDDEIKSLYVKISCLETELNKQYEDSANKSEEAEQHFQEQFEKEKERIIKEVTERLTRDHKKEIEGLRSRFKLMTCAAMDRNASDTSLEKIERGELIEFANHEAILAEVKENMKIQLEKAVSNERCIYEAKLSTQLKNFSNKFEEEKQLITEQAKKQVFRECDNQIDIYKSKENTLLSELQKHKETIHMLTSPERGSYSLLNRIEELEREKSRLEAELIKERATKYSFSHSSSSLSNSSYVHCANDSSGSSTSLASNSSPELQAARTRFKDRSSYKKSRASSSSSDGKVNITTCNTGDSVLVVWDDQQHNYTILQDSRTPYFLHPSCIKSLGLGPSSDGSPKRFFCPALVLEKEYCVPKKPMNRYNLKEGERFYRVKVKPLLGMDHPA